MIDLAEYRAFIAGKSQMGGEFGFEPTFIHPRAYDFQNDLVNTATRMGRSAIFADCGLGKTLMQLTWAHNVNRKTAKPVLILAPLMVALQTVDEASLFDFEAERSQDGKFKTKNGIVTANYERLHYFNPDDFSGIVADESSVLKNFDGARKSAITEFMKKIPYRLLCSATPSPNDYIELGTSSEALGNLGYMDMLSMFFKNDEDSLHPMSMGSQWRFKSHAQSDFWRWLCSWARAIRKPSDLGYEDGEFVLPKLFENIHTIESKPLDGNLWAMPAKGLLEERAERKATILGRCELAASLHLERDTGVAWCHLNAEADALVSMLPGSKQVKGSDHDDLKEELFTAFKSGQLKRLVTKPKIAAYGINWQHCNYMTSFADHSFEQYYQSVRRFWRFGQKKDVVSDTVTTTGLSMVTKNRAIKAAKADNMFNMIIQEMNNSLKIDRLTEHKNSQEIPKWL